MCLLFNVGLYAVRRILTVVLFVQLSMDSRDDKIKALLWSQEFHFFNSWKSVELDRRALKLTPLN